MCVKELYNLDIIIHENKSVYKYLLWKIIIAVVLIFFISVLQCHYYKFSGLFNIKFTFFLTSIGRKI